MNLFHKIPRASFITLALLAALGVAGFIAFLIGNSYFAQVELQKAALNNFRRDLEEQATALSYFYAERQNDLQNLPARREISMYFQNQALGMSVEYGLKASLAAIQKRFDQALEQSKLGDDRIYTRLAFVDAKGVCLACSSFDEGACEPPLDDWQRFLAPTASGPRIIVERCAASEDVLVSSPYFFKDKYAGQIIAWISASTVQKRLIRSPQDEVSQKIVALYYRPGKFYLQSHRNFPPGPTILPDPHRMRPGLCFHFWPSPRRDGPEMIAAMVPIQGAGLDLVGAIPGDNLFGGIAPWQLLAALVSMSFLFLAVAGIVWRANTRNVILHTRLEEAANREREFAEKNRQLEQEIAERCRTQELLGDVEEKYRIIFDDAVEGIFQSTPDGRFLRANPAAARIYGYDSPEELLDQVADIGAQIYVDPRRRSAFKNLIERTGVVSEFEYRAYRKDGSIIWILENARAVYGHDGGLLYYEGFLQDITARKEAEELTQNLIMASPAGIYIIQDGKFRLANRRFHKITGYARDELFSLEPFQLIHPDDRETVRQNAADMLRAKSSAPFEYRILTKRGQVKWIMETVVPTQYRGKRATLSFFIDITQRKELESQFIQAQKMEAVGRLAGGVAHDFNNMLMAVMCYSQMLKSELGDVDPLCQYAEEITKASRKAIALIRQLLTFSSKPVLEPEILNLNDGLNDIEEMLRRLIGEDLELSLDLDPGLPQVEADPAKIDQVIMNLAVNARDAMPQGGRLTIKTTAKPSQSKSPGAPASYVVLSVTDTGTGMDAETQSRIFEPFFTTKEPGKGTGLGLSTVYGIVRQTGGHISVTSQPGRGTTFEIFFPKAEPEALSSQAKADRSAAWQGQETILVVEDDTALRAVLAMSLRMQGYTVLEARQGVEALQVWQEHQGPLHLLITDVVMPRMGGTELVRRLTDIHPDLKVLFISGYPQNLVIHPRRFTAAASFLQKPIEPGVLAEKVRRLLDAPRPDAAASNGPA